MYRLTITNKDKTEIDEPIGDDLAGALRAANEFVNKLEEAFKNAEIDITLGEGENARVVRTIKGASDDRVVRILGDDGRVYYEYTIKGNKGGETW